MDDQNAIGRAAVEGHGPVQERLTGIVQLRPQVGKFGRALRLCLCHGRTHNEVAKLAAHAVFMVPLDERHLETRAAAKTFDIGNHACRIRPLVDQVANEDEPVRRLKIQLADKRTQGREHPVHVTYDA